MGSLEILFIIIIKVGSDESHFIVSLIVRDKVTRQCPQTTTFEEKGEPKQIRTRRSFCLPASRLTAGPNPSLLRRLFVHLFVPTTKSEKRVTARPVRKGTHRELDIFVRKGAHKKLDIFVRKGVHKELDIFVRRGAHKELEIFVRKGTHKELDIFVRKGTHKELDIFVRKGTHKELDIFVRKGIHKELDTFVRKGTHKELDISRGKELTES